MAMPAVQLLVDNVHHIGHFAAPVKICRGLDVSPGANTNVDTPDVDVLRSRRAMSSATILAAACSQPTSVIHSYIV